MKPQRTLIIGDIHGNLEALLGSLENAKFDINKDRIICLGDYIDGWENSFEVVRTLLEIKNKSKFNNVFILGNHDKWFLEVLKNDFSFLRDEEHIKNKYQSWYFQSGKSTYESYLNYSDEFIKIHKEHFFDKLKYYHIEENRLFIHAGFHIDLGFEETCRTKKDELLWDRSLYRTALQTWLTNKNLKNLGKQIVDIKFDKFETIFIGHTPTNNDGFSTPKRMANIINLDQGCKKNNILTIWDLESGQFYQNIQ